MASVESLYDLLVSELRNLYDAEQQLTKAIPKWVEASFSTDLANALSRHLDHGRQQVARLEVAFGNLGEDATGETCSGIKGLISEGVACVADWEADRVRDAAIVAVAQRVKHYEIAAYVTAIAHARSLGRDVVARLLQTTLAEEEAAERALTEIAKNEGNPDAVAATEAPTATA